MSMGFEINRDDIPRHFETVVINPWVLLAGWIVATAGVGAGVATAAGAQRLPAEALGVLLAGIGGALAIVLVRCRRIETTVTERLLTVTAGPLRRRVPIGFIEGCDARSARSWRRFFSAWELVVDIGHESRRLAIPTADADELACALPCRSAAAGGRQ